MKFIKTLRHSTYPIQTWTTEEGITLERVRITGPLSCRYKWYLNGSQIDGFTASQLLKDSH